MAWMGKRTWISRLIVIVIEGSGLTDGGALDCRFVYLRGSVICLRTARLRY